MTGQTIELRRPEQVVEHLPGLTHSLDYGKEGLAVNATRIGAPVRNTIETFWSQVEVTGACWLWVGGLTDEGYGYYWLDGTTRGAHRIAYLHLVGEVPHGMHLDHLCRVRNCVNPDHLEVVSPAVNSERANRPRVSATHCTHGHEWTPQNTLEMGESKRCRQCILVRGHRRQGIACDYDAFCSDSVHERGKYEAADVCSKGHSMADAYVRPDGTGRMCRECRRLRERKSAIRCPDEPEPTPKEDQ